MSFFIAIGVIWFWSCRCYDKKTRKRIGAATAIGSGIVWFKFARDLLNIDKTTKF